MKHGSIVRRWGKSPQELNISVTGATCPDILETSRGSFVVIGHQIPSDIEDSIAVMIPRRTAMSASTELAKSLSQDL